MQRTGVKVIKKTIMQVYGLERTLFKLIKRAQKIA